MRTRVLGNGMLVLAAVTLLGAGCAGSNGTDGAPGANGTSCTVKDNGDGTKTITCTDDTSAVISDGAKGDAGDRGTAGTDGASCSVVDNGDGTKTVTCGTTTVTLANGTDGAKGDTGDAGTDGDDCSVTDNGDGTKTVTCGATSVTLANGATGDAGADGTSCTVTDDGAGTKTIACSDDTSAIVRDGVDGKDGVDGQPGAGYLALEPAGVVGFVRDTAEKAVVGATVYLVSNLDIPTDPIDLGNIENARASTVDEPLEDTIRAKGATYAQAVTDANGIYRIATVPAGRFYVVALPAADDGLHLPGGSLCRQSLEDSALVGKQLDIELSTKPSPDAEYVGASVCLTCHGVTHEKQTLHYLGIQVMGQPGPNQDLSRFPDWNGALDQYFTTDGTTLYFYGFNGNAAAPDWKVSSVDPRIADAAAVVSFTARMYADSGKYYVELADVKGSTGTKTYEAGLSYGGGLYKQRYVTKIGSSWYVLPIQFNTVPVATEVGTPYSRWTFQHYNAQNWYTEDLATPANSKLREPAKTKSFDNNCAGCHFTGYQLTGDSTAGFQAHAVADKDGEFDFDGDGKAEDMNITCETCHGPGSEHWEWAGNGRAIVSPNLLTPEREITICAQCHTRALGIGGANTEAPMDASGRMMVAGTSREDFLKNHVSKLDDGLWDASKGDGKHAKKHHQQASDFFKSAKYRNPWDLLTCATCHDPHGKSPNNAQLRDVADSASNGEGLCLGCHSPFFPEGANTAKRMQAHYASQGIVDMPMGDIACMDCHMPKTAKSGAAGEPQALLAGVTYYHGDIRSHVFDVPLRGSIATKAGDMMAIPYTDGCGSCHSDAP